MLWGRFMFDRPREDLMRHLIDWDEAESSLSSRRKEFNLGLISTRQTKEEFSVFSTRIPVGQHKLATPYDGSYVSPLYLYANGNLPEEHLFAHDNGRRPNLSAEFIKELCVKLQGKFVPDGLGRPGRREFGPEFIFQYAYAVFHSPAYRERYAEFLRADFPRLPITCNFELFRILGGLGAGLVGLHARGKGEPRGLSFPVKGDNVIEEVRYQSPQGEEPGRVWINDRQHIAGVPESAWTFPIGGYLPAQRWLKDRMGRTLGYEEQTEYQRIIWALMRTKSLMGEIDTAISAHGGWPLK
jgi:predicted helicase